MAASVFTPSYQGLGDNVLRAGFMVAEMRSRAEKVMAFAIATAPVYEGPDDEHRGRYKASFSVSSTNHGGWKGNRAAGIVTNSAPEAPAVEFGIRPSGHERGQGAHATLRRALSAAG